MGFLGVEFWVSGGFDVFKTIAEVTVLSWQYRTDNKQQTPATQGWHKSGIRVAQFGRFVVLMDDLGDEDSNSQV
jgi:hypothetical protein